MFTGIIERLGKVKTLIKDKENLNITIESDLTPELKIDQSVSHNGVCLTVVHIDNQQYTVTAIKETLKKSNIWNISDTLSTHHGWCLSNTLQQK